MPCVNSAWSVEEQWTCPIELREIAHSRRGGRNFEVAFVPTFVRKVRR
jgi:hypothetical protein